MIDIGHSKRGYPCSQCGRYIHVLVHIGEEEHPDYTVEAVTLCRDCVLLALMAFEEVAA